MREMPIEPVGKRFGDVDAIPKGRAVQFLSDNGGTYIAGDTRAIARSLGLKPITTSVCSPQSNGIAESVLNTFRRDYVSRADLTDAEAVLAQPPAALKHFNVVHHHSSLKMMSPKGVQRTSKALRS